VSSSKTVLVTGAAGFIGSHTASALLRRGDTVVGLDNLNDYYDPARKRANLAELETEVGARFADFRFVHGDIRDRPLLEELFSTHRFDAVVHLAAMAGVRVSIDDPWLYCATARHGKPNFVFASTSSAYGNTKLIPFVETDSADRPLAPYPASKRAAELIGHSYHHIQGVDFTALRFFTVYGPRGRPDMMAFKVLDNIRIGREVPLYNEGQMHRDWTYVEDIVSGVVAAADVRLGYEVINIGRGEPVLLADFVQAIEELAGKKARLTPAPMMDADVAYTRADVSKARRLLGYSPRISVQDGVRSFYDWYQRAIAAK
jgi:UDP-glucuronate 4-epimerase